MAGLQNVLIVEDDVMIRELYRTTLIRDGYKVEVGGDSTEAFEKLKSFHAEIVLLDIMLPGMSGIDILRELKTNKEHGCQNAKIVMLTNLAQKDFADTAFSLGADAYIVKADILPKDLKQIISSLANQETKPQ